MKKTLEDELMTLAHRILQNREKDIEELRTASRQLYEKLTILSFTENHFTARQSHISLEDVNQALKEETKIERSESHIPYEKKTKPSDIPPTPSVKTTFQDRETTPPEKNISKKPLREDSGHSEQNKKSSSEVDLGEIAVNFDDLPQFEPLKPSSSTPLYKKKEVKKPASPQKPEQQVGERSKKSKDRNVSHTPNLFSARPKTKNDINDHPKSLNQRLNNSLNFGLNDRLAFINNLFEGNTTDFNRVISQLNTFENFEEARQFLEEQVKPDYNWEEKPVHQSRFLKAVESRMTD